MALSIRLAREAACPFPGRTAGYTEAQLAELTPIANAAAAAAAPIGVAPPAVPSVDGVLGPDLLDELFAFAGVPDYDDGGDDPLGLGFELT